MPHDLIAPLDEHNRRLLANVHPAPYENPTPQGRYNLVVLGAGTAGLVTAAAAAGLGAKVALVERHLMGGDCLNVGCVPSKALIRASRAVHEIRTAERFGIELGGEPRVDFAAVMERLRRLRADISRNDSVSRFRDELGVDVYIGSARFAGDDVVEVGDRRLVFSKAVIATGARAARPPIPGIDDVDVLTNENVFELTELPSRLAVIGAGPIGCELGQAFRRFGADVLVVTQEFLPKEDRDTAGTILDSLRRDGVEVVLGANILSVHRRGNEKLLRYRVDGTEIEIVVDAILLGGGRTPNLEGLELEKVGVRYSRDGVEVDDGLRTTNPRIFAAGDICSPFKFTHAADAMARIVIRNALFFGRAKMSALHIPWCTYTSPEVAHVGLTVADAESRHIDATTLVVDLDDVDRAFLDGETDGFAKVVLKQGTDEILGLTIVAAHAGEMIGEVVLAMNRKVGLSKFADTIHPYPTQAEILRKLGDAYNRTRLTPTVKTIFHKLMAWQR